MAFSRFSLLGRGGFVDAMLIVLLREEEGLEIQRYFKIVRDAGGCDGLVRKHRWYPANPLLDSSKLAGEIRRRTA